MSEKKGIELDDQELEKVAGGRWQSVQDPGTTDDSTTDPTSTGKGKNK